MAEAVPSPTAPVPSPEPAGPTASGLPDATGTEPIVLDAYAARSCPVKTQNRYDRTITVAPQQSRSGGQGPDAGEADEALLELFAGGRAHEVEMLSLVAARASGVVDLRSDTTTATGEQDDEPAAREQATRAAVESGARIILGPVLPDDAVGHRRGSPDLLVRGTDRADGRPGYVPVEVKRHRVVEQCNGQPCRTRVSPLSNPTPAGSQPLPAWVVRAGREGDLLQLAHHWRQLDGLGWGVDEPLAGIIGTDQLSSAGGPMVTWVELREKFLRTFSRRAASGWALRSPLERYDHEFGFRVKVAEVARRRTGSPDDPRPMVQPIVIRECDHCLWWSACAPRLADDDLSLRINKSPLDVREIGALRAHGIETLTDLVGADIDALLTTYLPEVRHREGAERRLRLAARRAELLLNGVDLQRLTDDPIDLPRHALEIDLDIETTSDDRVYLWGFLVDDRRRPAQAPYYVEFSSFTDLDTDSENDLARRAIDWLDRQMSEEPDTAVYYYSDFEPLHINRIARRTRDAGFLQVAERVNAHGVDMFALIRQNFFGANGLGLKVVARAGAGFEWRDEDPGGLNSQRWFADAIREPASPAAQASRQRVLDYNEDDVRATHALRRWLRSLDA